MASLANVGSRLFTGQSTNYLWVIFLFASVAGLLIPVQSIGYCVTLITLGLSVGLVGFEIGDDAPHYSIVIGSVLIAAGQVVAVGTILLG